MLEQILKSIDLSNKEAHIYLAALANGIAPISLIAKQASLSRSTGYNILQGLLKKGLVRRFDRGKIQYYSALPPHELIDFLERKKEEYAQKVNVIKTYLPQFETIQNTNSALPKVYFFEGIQGIKQIYQNILKTNHKETYAALSLDNIAPELKKWVFNVFTPQKIKKNIHSKVIVSSKKSKAYHKLDRKHLRESLVVPHTDFPFEVEIDVYDDHKTAFISFDQSEMLGVIIESTKIAHTLKSLLNLIWDKNITNRNHTNKEEDKAT